MNVSENLAPVIVFCYNRPWHLSQTIESLQRNTLAHLSELIIFSDGPKKDADKPLIEEIRQYLSSVTGFKNVKIFESEENNGLANSVISGVSKVLTEHKKAIVLEDDMLTTTDFLEFMNEALSTYEARMDIFSITAYSPPFEVPVNYKHDLFMVPRASSWGWATWLDRWEKADWEVSDFQTLKNKPDFVKKFTAGGEDLWPMLYKQQKGIIDSWAIRWTLSQFRNHAYGLYPVKSKIKNIGTDGSGTNFKFTTDQYDNSLNHDRLTIPFDLQPNTAVLASFKKYYKLKWVVKLKNLIKFGLI